MGGNFQDGSSESQRSSNDRTDQSGGGAGGSGSGGGGGGSSGSGDSYHYQPAGSNSSGSNPPAGSGSSASNPSGSGSGFGHHSGSGSGAGTGSGSGSGGYYHSGSGSGGSGEYYQGSGEKSGGSGSGAGSGDGSGGKSGNGSGSGSGSGSQPSGSFQAVGGSSSDQNTSSETKQSSSSRTGSSVTWHEKVSDSPAHDDESYRRSSSVFDGEISSKTGDSGRSSIRRFKEGSKIIEDADGLEPSDDMLPPMTWEEKCEIIEELCFALEKRLDRLKSEKDGVLDGLKNYYDVAEHKSGMARKDRVEMQRNVIQFAELLNPTGKPYSEDMFRYLNGRILDKRLLKEKLETRNKRLEKMVATATEQLESKLDVRELLHDSDFMEMRKVNEDLAMQLDARARFLEKSRDISRKIALTTEEMREKMEKTAEDKVSIRQSLSDRSPLINKLQALIAQEYKERERLHLEHLAFVKGEDMTPTALDYMKIRQRSKTVRKELYNWLAKVEIAEMKHSQLTKNIAMLQTVAPQVQG